ncbi:MAG: signal peptidase I [Firmicutes bacterium]|nr:signal peptidase I [Bacillota bacterium]
MKGWIRDIAIVSAVVMAATLTIKPTVVKANSMQPTLYANNYLLVNKQAYRFGEEKRGDIIVFQSELKDKKGKDKLLIKRIIGLPGDTIRIKDGAVFLNGERLTEDYIMEVETPGNLADYTVPEGKLFVMGDNRRVSIDSRSPEVGCIDEDTVMGKAFVRLYPFREIGTID